MLLETTRITQACLEVGMALYLKIEGLEWLQHPFLSVKLT